MIHCTGEDQSHHIDPTVDQATPPPAFIGKKTPQRALQKTLQMTQQITLQVIQ